MNILQLIYSSFEGHLGSPHFLATTHTVAVITYTPTSSVGKILLLCTLNNIWCWKTLFLTQSTTFHLTSRSLPTLSSSCPTVLSSTVFVLPHLPDFWILKCPRAQASDHSSLYQPFRRSDSVLKYLLFIEDSQIYIYTPYSQPLTSDQVTQMPPLFPTWMNNSHLKLKMSKIQISVLTGPLICSFHGYHCPSLEVPSSWVLRQKLWPLNSLSPSSRSKLSTNPVLFSKYIQNLAIYFNFFTVDTLA